MTTGNFSARELVRIIGGLLDPTNENLGRYLHRVSMATGLPVRLIEAAWHCEAVSKNTQLILRAKAEGIANEKRDTAIRFEQIAERLEAVDADFYRRDIDALRALASRTRSKIDRKR